MQHKTNATLNNILYNTRGCLQMSQFKEFVKIVRSAPQQLHFSQSVWTLSVVVDSLREETALVVLARILQMV